MQASMTAPTTFSTFKSILLPTFDLIGPNPLPPLTVCVRSRKTTKKKTVLLSVRVLCSGRGCGRPFESRSKFYVFRREISPFAFHFRSGNGPQDSCGGFMLTFV